MVKKKKSKRAKVKKIIHKLLNNRYFVVACAVILFLLLSCTLFLIFNRSGSAKFKVQSRVNNIEKVKKEDPTDVETFAWVKVQGTNIDYPVIYAPFTDVSAIASDFAWSEMKHDSLPNAVFLSGHNVKNLSKNPYVKDRTHKRFEQLMSFTYIDFIQNNQFIQFTLDGEDYVYKIYSVSYPDAEFHSNYEYSELDKTKFKSYIRKTVEMSIFDTNVDVNENDKIITLTTCTRMFDTDKEFNVSARLLRENEKIALSKIEKTSNYDEVEKAMKGDDINEES